MASEKLTSDAFRTVFKVVDKELLNWFPGHMNKGLKQMQHKLRSIDCVIEVHDARIPLSGRNTDFKYTVSGVKPHILVLNKVDLIGQKYISKIRERLKDDCENIIFTNSNDRKCRGVAKLLPLAQELIQSSERFNRSSAEDFCFMIIGIPNVGKSSLINALRIKHLHKGKATHVGAAPGITRSVLNKIKMSQNPLVYMLDTPGILTPKVPNTETGLKLSLCNTMQNHLVGEEIIADYLLYWMNKNRHFKYVKHFELEKANDNILEVLTHISNKEKKFIRLKNQLNELILKPNLHEGAKIMIRAFWDGHLGKIMLDEDIL